MGQLINAAFILKMTDILTLIVTKYYYNYTRSTRPFNTFNVDTHADQSWPWYTTTKLAENEHKNIFMDKMLRICLPFLVNGTSYHPKLATRRIYELSSSIKQ